jgi:hypothetical protein
VLLFTDVNAGINYREQIGLLLHDTEGLEERDLKIFKISTNGTAEDILERKTLQVEQNIRMKYNLACQGFQVLLIGKDGTVKYSDSNPVSKEKLFAIIDAMPMRKAELWTE